MSSNIFSVLPALFFWGFYYTFVSQLKSSTVHLILSLFFNMGFSPFLLCFVQFLLLCFKFTNICFSNVQPSTNPIKNIFSNTDVVVFSYGCSLWSFLYLWCISLTFWTYEIQQWHPTPVLLPGKSHGRRSLVGCSPWSCEESDKTERLHFHFSL